MRGIILAAGRGTRMQGMTDAQPKCLVEIRGRTLLDWQLMAMRDAGIREIAIVTGYRREALATRGLTEFFNSRWSDTNMVASLACAHEWLSTSPCLVSYSDLFYGADAVRSLMTSDADVAVTYDPHWEALWRKRFGDPLLDAETFRLAPDGRVIDIGNPPRTLAEVEGQYMGVLRFTPVGWGEVCRVRATLTQDARDRLHMTGTLQLVIEAGRLGVQAIPYEGEWGEVDSESDVRVFQGATDGNHQ